LDGIPHGLDRAQMNQAISELNPLRTLEYLKTRYKETELDSLVDGRMSKAMKDEIDGRKQRLDAILFNGSSTCMKCHDSSNDPSSIVAPSNLKRKWLRGASFNHGAHLMVSCRDCHAEAYRTSSDVFDREMVGNRKSEEESDQVMIAGLAKCRECHIQDAQLRSKKFATLKHVATADCVDCHKYHSDSPGPNEAGKAAPAFAATLDEVHRLLAREKSN
jgi:hypothetical protein